MRLTKKALALLLLAPGATWAQLVGGGGVRLPQTPAPAPAAPPQVLVGSRPYIPHQVRLRAETNLVQIAVVVRDNLGRPVSGLTAPDFKLFDRGKQQKINGFVVQSSAPAKPPRPASTGSKPGRAAPVPVPQPESVALFFDDNSMATGDLMMARNSAEKYLNQGLLLGQRVGVFTSSSVHQLGFTDDAESVMAAVRKLGTELRMGPAGQPIGTVTVNPYVAYMAVTVGQPFTGILEKELKDANLCQDPISCRFMATAEAQTILEQVEQSSSDTFASLQRAIAALGRQPGLRTLLLTSDGFLSGTWQLRAREQEVIDAALQNGVVINTLDATLLQTDDPTQLPLLQSLRLAMQESDRDPLYDLAAATGGDFFHDNNDLAGALRNMANGPSVRYLLSFSPAAMKYDGAFHAISVKLAHGVHGDVQARKGYYDPSPEQDAFAVLPQALLDREMLGGDAQASLAATADIETAAAPGGQRRLTVRVRVDAARLPFSHHRGRSDDDLGFAIAAFDRSGKFVAGKQGVLELRLAKKTLAQFEKTGVAGALSLTLPPGIYRLRELAREANRGEMTTLTRNLEVR